MLACPRAFFLPPHLASGGPVPLVRAKALYRWVVVVVLGTFNLVIFTRVFEGLRALW